MSGFRYIGCHVITSTPHISPTPSSLSLSPLLFSIYFFPIFHILLPHLCSFLSSSLFLSDQVGVSDDVCNQRGKNHLCYLPRDVISMVLLVERKGSRRYWTQWMEIRRQKESRDHIWTFSYVTVYSYMKNNDTL